MAEKRKTSSATAAGSDLLTPDDVAEDINPLHYAAAMGDKKTLAALLLKKSDPRNSPSSLDVYGRTALVYAVVSGKQACAEILLKSGTDVSAVDNVCPSCVRESHGRRGGPPSTGQHSTSNPKWSSCSSPMGQIPLPQTMSNDFACTSV
jgi:ankyrin repeat protein